MIDMAASNLVLGKSASQGLGMETQATHLLLVLGRQEGASGGQCSKAEQGFIQSLQEEILVLGVGGLWCGPRHAIQRAFMQDVNVSKCKKVHTSSAREAKAP